MKKVTVVLVLLLSIFVLTACKTDDMKIIHNNDIVDEVFLVSSFGNEYNIYLPIATNNKVETLELDSLLGENVELLKCSLEFSNLNEKIGNSYINGFSLMFKCESDFPQISITGLKLLIDGDLIEYKIGTIKFSKLDSLEQSYDHLMFLGSPVTGYSFSGSYTWETEVQKPLKINKIYTCSDKVSIKEISLNSETVDATNISKTFKKGDELKISLTFNSEDANYDKSIVGFDIIIEYIDEETKQVFFSKAPAIFRIYACQNDFSLLYT